jgi:hypothetical protein
MTGKSKTGWIILVALVILIKVFSFFPGAVERFYSRGLYLVFARILRVLLGWVPFSVGDIIYTCAVAWLIYVLVRFVRRLIQRKLERGWLWKTVRGTIWVMLVIYVYFNLSWGLNYDRKGIAQQLDLTVKPYSNEELQTLVKITVQKLNAVDSQARENRDGLEKNRQLFDGAIEAYAQLALVDGRFQYPAPSVKASLLGVLDNYMGFYGYYNPFTGEAQVNTNVPVFTLPFTVCHEIGHQLGYAKENEANFAGFLSSRSNPDPNFLYSVYFDMYQYAARELYVRDSTLLVPLRESLHKPIRKDFRDLIAFNRHYDNLVEPMVRGLYGGYLRANRQPQGLKTYNEVVAWLIAYGNKYGWEKI